MHHIILTKNSPCDDQLTIYVSKNTDTLYELCEKCNELAHTFEMLGGDLQTENINVDLWDMDQHVQIDWRYILEK